MPNRKDRTSAPLLLYPSTRSPFVQLGHQSNPFVWCELEDPRPFTAGRGPFNFRVYTRRNPVEGDQAGIRLSDGVRQSQLGRGRPPHRASRRYG